MKKLLLIGTVLLTANSAVANVYDILTWGSGSISGGQKLEVTGTSRTNQNWKADNTGININLNINGSDGINTNSLPTNNFDSSKWNNSSALEALMESSGMQKSDFSGLTSGLYVGGKTSQATNGAQFSFSGFEENKKYKLTLLVNSHTGNLNVRTQGSGASGKGLDIVCQYGDMMGQDWAKVTNAFQGAQIKANSQTLISFDITATSADNALVLFFDNVTTPTGVSASAIDFIAIGAIPEPSAFGMLAGLGALAFVGARRRRNRR